MSQYTRYTKISIRPTVNNSFMFYDVNQIQFTRDKLGRDYYVIKEYELAVVSEFEQSPTRYIESGQSGDYLFKDSRGNLKIIPAYQVTLLWIN